MSVNYSKLHPVDMPITDLDDRDDDIVFDQQHQAFDPLEGLDYEENDMLRRNREEQSQSEAGFFGNISNAFTNLGDRFRSNVPVRYTRTDSGSTDSPTSVEWWAAKIRNAGRSLRRTDSIELQNRNNATGEFNISSDEDQDILSGKAGIPGHSYVNKKSMFGIICFVIVSVLLFLTIPNAFKDKNGKAYMLDKPLYSNSTHEFHPTTIVISLDGFHPHYINAKLTPTLHNMLLHDYGAPYMIPSFPSSTFPNHWTLVTGLYPSEHGIVGNTFYDPKLDRQFVNTNPEKGALDPDFWKGGEPVWETAHKQGVISAIHMWPGSEVPGVGIHNGPKFVDRYNGSETLSSKVDKVMSWLDIEDIKERPELILTYVPTIDTFGHKYGISGPELEEALTYVDDFVALLLMELKARRLDDIANVIIVSDHGMAPTSNDRLLYIDDMIDLNNEIEHVDGWPLFGLRPSNTENEGEVDKIIKEYEKNVPKDLSAHFTIYKVEDLPEEWQFGGQLEDHRFNYRLAPIWVIPDVGYAVTTHKQMKDNGYEYKPKGVHGYNNTELLMRAIFLGHGPYFDSKLENTEDMKKVLPFQNTEVYNLICDTLNLRPAPNNGTFSTSKGGESVHSQNLLSFVNLLPNDWVDVLEYPNLPFKVDHVVKDSTYDLLWKKPLRNEPTTVSVSTNTNPLESLKSGAKTLADVTEHIPKPTDLTESGSAEPTSAPPEDENKDANKGDDDNGKGKGNGSWWDGISDTLGHLGDDVDDLFNDVFDGVGDIFGNMFHHSDGSN